ncbi:MAG: hypothetical protein U9N34_06390 [Candidatus Cloacimonadota bacterium]|nr:hypothetical protein [Candidatus Cloacimonadota bacterium]
MKLGVLLQIIVILLLLFFIILGNNKFEEYSAAKEAEFESYLMIIESKDGSFLDELHSRLEAQDMINSVELVSPQTRTEEVRKKFNESFPQKVIEQLEIPGQLSISFDYPSIFDEDFLDLQRSFQLPPKSEIFFDKQRYYNFKKNYSTSQNVFNYFFIGFIALAFLILIRIRIYFEMLYDHFWKTLHRAGGDITERKKTYWQTSFIMIFVVVIALIGYLFYLHQNINYSLFEIKFILSTALYLLFVNLFAKLFMWKQKW